MRVFTKIGLALLVGVLSTGMLWAQSSMRDIGPKTTKAGVPIATEAMFDLQFDFPVGVGGGEAGIETDGQYIYTSKWNGTGDFYKYALDGTYLETFVVSGAAGCRDIAYDGTYFYGGAASTTVFQMDFGTATMVSTFTAPTPVRAIAYNEDDGAFYANNWGSDITKFDMTGANLGSFPVGPTGDSYYGFAYQGASYCGDGPFLWGYAQVGATQNELVQISLPDGTETGTYFDVGSVAAVGTGIAGGLAIAEGLVTGYWTILGTAQNVDIWGLELCVSGPLPDNDIGVQAITSPSTGTNLSNAEMVTVVVKNYGNNTQTSFDVSYTVDGGTPVTETVNTTLASGDTYEHTFATTVDLSAYGAYVFEACATLAGDENPANDCATKTVENLEPSLCTPVYSTGCTWGDGFTDFAVEEIQNFGTGCEDNTGFPGWSQYLNLGPATLMPGATHTFTMATGYANNFVDIWVDWNDDLVLTDDEHILDDFEMVEAGVMYDVDITIPADAPAGQHIMRARTNWNGTVLDACEPYSYGEAEDYYIVIPGGLEYCEASGGGDEYIDGVEFGDISNLGSGATGYGDWTSLSTDVAQGETYSLTVYNGNAYSSDDWGVWIDFNQDGTFADDEMLVCDISNGGDVITYDIEIPGDAMLGSTRMRIRLKWSGGDCPFDPCGTTTYGEVEDYTVNVVEGTPNVMIFADDFEAYAAGQQLACQNPDDWTTWSNAPCDPTEDPYVSSDQAYSGVNSVNIVNDNDLVKPFDETGEYTSGHYLVSFMMYIPTGNDAYWNILSEWAATQSWALEVFFDNGSGSTSQGGGTFTYNYDTWMMMEVDIDLDNDWAIFKIDDVVIQEWPWSDGGVNALGAIDFYGYQQTNPCNYYIDDFGIEEVATPTLNPPTNLMAEVIDMDVLLTWDPPAGKALLGYNVYRDGSMIDYTTDVTYTDMGLDPGTYEYYVTAVYDEGESDPSNTVSVEVIGGSNCLFEDDFESYTVGMQLAQQNPDDWTTWSNSPGSDEDPYIVDNGGNVVEITGVNDLVHVIPNYTSGFYSITFDMYIPAGNDAYFNTLQEFAGGNSQWGMQVYFDAGGAGSIDGGGAAAATFTFNYDTWMAIQVDVDLDNDWAEFFVDGNLIHGWVWSSGTFGTGNLNQLGGNNFYAWVGANGSPLYHFDNYCVAGQEPLAPPTNLQATVEDNDVYLTWDAPDGESIITAKGEMIGAPALEASPSANNNPIPTDDMFDLLFDFPVGVGGGEAGIETDGTYIYTSMWNGAGEFQKYAADGTWLETFTIAGAAGCRDIAYDGTYFYGGAASTTVFQMDFDNATMVSTFTAPTNVRAIAYNEVDDAFYANNWGSDITKFDMAGANLGSFPVGPTGDSYYGFAFDNYSGGTYLWGYAQVGATQNELVQISLPDGTETGTYFDVGSVAAVGTGIAGGLCIDGSLVSGVWAIIGTAQNVDIWGLELAAGGSSDISYNVYRDGALIGNTANTSYDDMDLENGTYEYYVTAVYPEGESGPSNVVEATIDVPQAIFFDDFEAYTAGQQLACQNPDDWTTWSNAPCDPTEDAYISDNYAYSGNNSVMIVQNNDQVKNLDTYFTSGAYSISMMVYVPSGADGYYNVMSDFDGGYEWAFEVYFNADGSGSVNAGGTGAATFTFPFDTWLMSEVKVNLDADWAEYYLDGEMIYGWQWTLGAAGGGSQLQLAAVDIYGPNLTTEFYFDDFMIDTWTPPALPAPENLTGPTQVLTGEDIVLVWDEPTLGATLQWDNGINDNSIGLTSGGTFAVASHWEPADLTPYDGMMLESISFFAGDYPGPTFIMKVWTGADATEVYSQPVTSFVQNDWNEIMLDTPVMIDASQDLWFGYETTHAAGEYPAGIDAGPAIQGYGDMIYNAGAWSSLYVLTGGALDGNWNIAGYASLGDGSESVVIGNTNTVAPAHAPVKNSGSFAALGFGSGKKLVPSGSKELLGYNVYRDGANIGNTTETTYTDNITVSGTYVYYVTAVYDNGESGPSNEWTVDVITGVDEQLASSISLFPNPASDVVNIVSDVTIDNVTIYNFAGQAVATEDVSANTYQVNTSQYEPGIYIFKVNTAEGIVISRVTVK